MKKISLAILSLLLFSLLLTGIARAAQNTSTLAADQVHQGFMARAAEKIVIDGTVQGDVWLAGSEIEIKGTIEGNVYAAAEKIKITGLVRGTIHAAGSEVLVSSQVDGSLYAAGSRVEITSDARVNRAAALAGSELKVGGSYGDRVFLAASDATVSGKIGQGLRAATTTLTLTETAVIGGDVRYESPQSATIANDKAITGRVIHDQPQQQSQQATWGLRVVDALLGYARNLVLAAVFLAIFGRQLTERAQAFRKQPLPSLTRGLLLIFFVPILAFISLITIIGIPLGILGILGYIAGFILAPIAMSFVLGIQFTRTAAHEVSASTYGQRLQLTALGLVGFSILIALPIFGPVLGFFLYTIGFSILLAQPLVLSKTKKIA